MVTGNSIVVYPSVTTTYTLTATNAAGSVTSKIEVTVMALPVIGSFVASPTSVAPGGASTLSWTTTGATSLSILGIGVVTGNSTAVYPSVTTTYTLTATNAAGSVSSYVAVTVTTWVLKWKRDIVYVGGKELAEVDATGASAIYTDHLGSPRLSWRGGANPVVRQKFLPFGEQLTNPTDAAKLAKGFTKHEQTDLSGLIYMQARYYLPMYGRFGSPDPAQDQHFELTQSWNIYSYIQNIPTMLIDPTGMAADEAESAKMAGKGKDGIVEDRTGIPILISKHTALTSDGGTGDITKRPSNIAPIQPDRFDGFGSRTEAEAYAKDFIVGTYGKNGGMDYREYGFYVYQTSETIGISKIIQGPVPEAGKRAAVDIDMGLKSVPRGATLIEDAHTHPRLSASGGRGLTASGEDMLGVRLMRGYGEDGVRYKGFKVDPLFQGVLMRLGTPRTLIYWGDSLRKGDFNDGEGPQVWR